MLLATSHPHELGPVFVGTVHGHAIHAPVWGVLLVYAAIFGLLIAGVLVTARAVRRMSRPGRIIVGLIAIYALVGAVVAFVDAYRPTDDWRGGIFEAAFIVLYGLVAAGVVWAADKTVKRLRASSPA